MLEGTVEGMEGGEGVKVSLFWASLAYTEYNYTALLFILKITEPFIVWLATIWQETGGTTTPCNEAVPTKLKTSTGHFPHQPLNLKKPKHSKRRFATGI